MPRSSEGKSFGGNDGPDKRRALRLFLIRFFLCGLHFDRTVFRLFRRRLFRGKSHFLQQEDERMDFLSGKIKTIYFKYLSAAFGSALITSIYSIVDMAMVGQYHGPEGPSFSAPSAEKRTGMFGNQTSILRLR